jgi:hypothetical protein
MHTATMAIVPVASSIEIRDEATLIDPTTAGSAEHFGAEYLNYRASSAPGRSVIDVVNQQPGWLLEANGILHPRGSEYDVQYVRPSSRRLISTADGFVPHSRSIFLWE